MGGFLCSGFRIGFFGVFVERGCRFEGELAFRLVVVLSLLVDVGILEVWREWIDSRSCFC